MFLQMAMCEGLIRIHDVIPFCHLSQPRKRVSLYLDKSYSIYSI